MKDLMCLIHRYMKAADNALSSAFKIRRGPPAASASNPAIQITEAPTMPVPGSAMRRRWTRSSKSNKTGPVAADAAAATAAANSGPNNPPDSRRASTSSRPPICHDEMSRSDMYEMLEALGAALPPTEYALIGGIACLLLGHTRETKDVDIIVPDGQAGRVAAMLAASPKFGTEKMASGRSRCWFVSAKSRLSYNVDVLEPHDIGQVFPDGKMETVLVANRPVLSPAQLLNYKVLGWTDRMGTTGYKKVNHARDILFLVDYMAKKGMRASREEIYHVTEDFLVMFCATHPEAKPLFESIGLARRGSSSAKSSIKSGKSGWAETSRFKSGGLLSA